MDPAFVPIILICVFLACASFAMLRTPYDPAWPEWTK